ncbi:long-chain fatty acid--CoA ligase [Salinibacterium sp. SYSU T00001]|uniref:acyl-CoA synthetase n=1 Tax=Homoserinimonas sedimenticola TaxID=2986805 RepID=UPI0022360AD5|nr:long-chain fatty acid--CoA ligase [Salinibacterium sedimenticola]MCW4386693.1 long-chain fatty acid--CoA ligase [Salinibacterium sedimenticola]
MLNQGIGSWLERRREKSGDKPAVIFAEKSTSYRELLDRVERLAAALRERGISQGDRVAYFGENHVAFLETLLAAATLGAIFVPLNARLAAPELAFGLTDSGSRILIHPKSLTVVAAAALRGTPVTHRIVVDDTALGAAITASVPVVGGEDDDEPGADDAVLESFEEVLAAANPESIDVAVGLDDPAIILYTSGTTGNPKGALLTHGNLTWNAINVIIDYDYQSTEVALMISPLFHVASLGMGVLPTLLKGGTLVLEPRFDPGRVLDVIQRHRVTSMSGVPTTYQMLSEHPLWESTDLSSLRQLTCGGSAVPIRVIDAFEERGLRFSGGYGMTETAPGITSIPAARSREKAGSAGLPHFFTSMRVVDEEGRPAEVGEPGEIQVSGPNVIREYWNRPDATSEAYAPDGWFRTGDIGYLDDDGFLTISDRLKDMIISGGENIYPAQVEQAIREIDAVGDVAVIGVPDERWGEVPWAIVSLREGRELSAEDVRRHLQGRLARFKVPKNVLFVDEFPRTASGKIRKADLRRKYGA